MHLVAERRAIVSPTGGLTYLDVEEEAGLVYVASCPCCGGRIPEPFVPPSDAPYPMVYTHLRGHGRPSCRIRVVVHPDGRIAGEDLCGTSYERALLGGT